MSFLKLNVFLFFFLSFTLLAFERLDSAQVIENMHEKIHSLDADNNFTFVDLELSNDDQRLINQFKIESSGQYSRFGSLNLMHDELSDFLCNVGNNDEEVIRKITKVIFEMAANVIKASHKETAWVCVRASTVNQAFDIPRWHWDGYYYSPYSGFAFKFVTTLKGNPTLFYQLPKDLREVFSLHSQDREFLTNLVDNGAIKSSKPGQGAFFIVGDRNNAAVHSEPKMESERLFFSVLPANEDEINELKSRWQH